MVGVAGRTVDRPAVVRIYAVGSGGTAQVVWAGSLHLTRTEG